MKMDIVHTARRLVCVCSCVECNNY